MSARERLNVALNLAIITIGLSLFFVPWLLSQLQKCGS